MLKEFYMYFLNNPIILHAGLLLTCCDSMLLFNINVKKKKKVLGVINVKRA